MPCPFTQQQDPSTFRRYFFKIDAQNKQFQLPRPLEGVYALMVSKLFWTNQSTDSTILALSSTIGTINQGLDCSSLTRNPYLTIMPAKGSYTLAYSKDNYTSIPDWVVDREGNELDIASMGFSVFADTSPMDSAVLAANPVFLEVTFFQKIRKLC